MKKVHVTLKNFYGQAYQGNKLMQLWHFLPYGYPVYTICCPRVPGCNCSALMRLMSIAWREHNLLLWIQNILKLMASVPLTNSTQMSHSSSAVKAYELMFFACRYVLKSMWQSVFRVAFLILKLSFSESSGYFALVDNRKRWRYPRKIFAL